MTSSNHGHGQRRVDAGLYAPRAAQQPQAQPHYPAPQAQPQPAVPAFAARGLEEPPAPTVQQSYQALGDAARALPPTMPASAPAMTAEEPDEPAAVAVLADGRRVVTFSRDYQAFGKPLRSVVIRPPVTRDIRKHGDPLSKRMDAQGLLQIDFRWDVVAAYAEALSEPQLPGSTVDSLEFFDLDLIAAAIAPFFIKLGR